MCNKDVRKKKRDKKQALPSVFEGNSNSEQHL